MFMLSYTNCVETADAGVGNLSEKSDSFIEAYIGIFASRLLSHLIRFGTPKDYVSKEENLSVIRGRIEFRKHSSLNCFDQSKVFCAFSEFSENNPLSQAFKYVAQTLLKFTSSSDNINTLNRCVGMLDGVVAKYISPSELTKAVVGKKNPNFVALISLLKMFLAKIRPEFSRTPEQKVFTLLFDMNELFEDFIIQTLKRHSTLLEIEVTAQKKRRLVSEERDLAGSRSWSPKKLFDTLTDISIKPKIGKEFIIDTKYKVISNEKSHYGISNQDAYQILAYRQIHKQNGEEPSVALLYPLGETALQKEFRITGSNTTFSAWTIDVSRDLKSSMNSFIEDLRVLIAHGTKVFEKDEAA
jgi:5-methylcytosine-specific restriction enzyme subunit McrC